VNFHLVGTHEADVLENRISDESPLGKTLVGKRSGDEVEWNGIDYKVINISYE
jgi:transcription elongation factor GreA